MHNVLSMAISILVEILLKYHVSICFHHLLSSDIQIATTLLTKYLSQIPSKSLSLHFKPIPSDLGDLSMAKVIFLQSTVLLPLLIK